MNKRQTEVEKKKLAEEAKELNHLKAIYNKAAEDIAENIKITDGKIEVLLRDWDTLSDDDKSVYQSKIYQKNFQKQLQSQINDVLKDLNSGQYKSIDEYLKKCYETGYIGTMYDIAGQGIPIITPIDQKKVITAMKTNSQIKTDLYTKLGEDVDVLKKRIANNISRGIATSDSYENIARNIANASKVGENNAMRIARTEGHRIHSNSAWDAQLAAKDAGADIVKQWDSTMDGNTRTTHRLLDGQIREVEEPFEMGGMKAMYPSGFGRPEEDINCRCALLQRATWALDEDELEALKEKAKFHEIYVEDDDKETFRKQKDIDLNTFTKRYLKATTTTATATKAVDVASAVTSLVPADSFEELNESFKLQTGITEVDFSGMGLDIANECATQYIELNKKYNNKVVKVDSKLKLGIGTAAQVERYGTDPHSILLFGANRFKSKEMVIKSYERALESKHWTKVDKDKISIANITHEFAHTLSSSMQQYDVEFWDEIKSIKRKYKRALTSIEKKKIVTKELTYEQAMAETDKIFISAYAMKNVDEFLAEAFTMATLNKNPSPYAKEVLAVVDKYFSKKPAAKTAKALENKSKNSKIILESKTNKTNKNIETYANQTDKALKKGIKKETELLELHMKKIEHPEEYIDGWENKNQYYKTGMINRWEKEVENFTHQIELRQKELDRRKNNE